jgi:protein ImuB
MRIACLSVPDFPLAALLRAQPELRGERVAVADGQGPRAPLLAISAAAEQRGVRTGLSVAQAVAIDRDLLVRTASPDLMQSAQAALCDAASSFSPRVEDAGAGVAYLDLDGLASLYDTESQLANALAQRALHLGLDAQVGVSGSKIAAMLAARHGGGVTVVPPGEEANLLAPVPVALLEPSPALRATLQRWGIRCLGDLAALPASAVGTRLGPEGVALVRRARGEDARPLVPRPVPLCFEESVDFEYGVETLEPLLFVLRGVLGRLTARLAVRGLICSDLRLALRLATRGRDERMVSVAAPSNDVKTLLALVQLHLEAHPPSAAIEALRLTAVPERLRAAQLDLFRPSGPAPAQLAVTLARLAAICGADRVGTPVVADSHRPDAYGVGAFGPGSDFLLPLPQGERGSEGRNVIPIALRAIRPPQAVEVFCARDQPEFVRGARFAGRVVHTAGPWRVQTDWWNEQSTTRDYYDVQLSDGGVYRLYYARVQHEWFVEGVYD